MIMQAFLNAFFGWTMPFIIGISIILIIKGVKIMTTVCDVCGKKFEGARAEGALRLHKLKAHAKGDCSHPNKRFLNPRVEIEVVALTQGYAEYCPHCREVFK